jgi:hypothetical protein
MNLLPWLFWRRAANKQQAKLDKVVEQMGENKVLAELAEQDPELRKALDSLGVKRQDDGEKGQS